MFGVQRWHVLLKQRIEPVLTRRTPLTGNSLTDTRACTGALKDVTAASHTLCYALMSLSSLAFRLTSFCDRTYLSAFLYIYIFLMIDRVDSTALAFLGSLYLLFISCGLLLDPGYQLWFASWSWYWFLLDWLLGLLYLLQTRIYAFTHQAPTRRYLI